MVDRRSVTLTQCLVAQRQSFPKARAVLEAKGESPKSLALRSKQKRLATSAIGYLAPKPIRAPRDIAGLLGEHHNA